VSVCLQGLWRGTTPALALTVPYCAVQFAVLNQCKAFAASRGLSESNWAPAVCFTSGAVAGAAATFASYPFDLLRTILASQGKPPVYKGMIDATRGILTQRGPRGLFSGVGITLVEIIPYAGIQFGAYDALKHSSDSLVASSGLKELSPQGAFTKQFLVGFLAGLMGKVCPPGCMHNRLPVLVSAMCTQLSGWSLHIPTPIQQMSSWPGSAVQLCTAVRSYMTPSTAEVAVLQCLAHGEALYHLNEQGQLIDRLQSVTHPLDVIKKRYQVTGLLRPLAYGARVNPEVTTALRICIAHIWRTEGAAGFFKGLTPSLVKVRLRHVAAPIMCQPQPVSSIAGVINAQALACVPSPPSSPSRTWFHTLSIDSGSVAERLRSAGGASFSCHLCGI
jgi:hypothetical protein